MIVLAFQFEFGYIGNLGIFNSRVSPAPSEDIKEETPRDIKKEAPAEGKDGTKPSCGCLGRDTIANAVAKAGPAVVNLSVPQGKHFKVLFLCYTI